MQDDAQYFKQENTKIENIRKQLESSNISEKLTGMKKVMARVSAGEDMEHMFPYVVKNVVVKHLEIKKLAYTFLTHYAERRPEEALLSVNNFQKDLGDKNQFIRALALRVMSSIRVDMITQVVIVSIKKCVLDVSPYVRKAACLAIPKAYALDKDLKSEVVEAISKLLNDNNTMVLGAAVFAFNEVCPDNWEIFHPHYRKLCKYLVDCDEWGQIVIINTLMRYARTQFVSPFKEGAFKEQAFYSDDEESDDEKKDRDINPTNYDLDPDHRLLLKSTQPLLRTRNAAVVLAVVSLYYHVAPPIECGKVIVSLLRLIRGSRENQYVVLSNIATMAKERPELFRDFIKDFYILATDPQFIKSLKLEILSLLANENNVHTILKELRSYIKFPETKFVALTIQSIGRIASKIPDIAEQCIADLMQLIKTNKAEEVVAESIVVIRHLIHSNPKEHERVIRKMAYLLETMNVPIAKASIVWMIGEYYDIVPKVAPDALRILAKNFIHEDDLVKLQAINLGTKLYLKEAKGIDLLFQYILNLGKYDMNYDIRDRVRLIRAMLFPQDKSKISKISEKAAHIFLAAKPPPSFKSHFQHERARFALGSLSHLVNHNATGYQPLGEFPDQMDEEGMKKRDLYDKRPESSTVGDHKATTLLTGDEDIVDFYKDVEDGEGSDIEGFLGEEGSWTESGESEGEGEYYDEEESGDEEVEGQTGTKPEQKAKKEEDEFTASEEYSSEEEDVDDKAETGSYSGSDDDSYTGSSYTGSDEEESEEESPAQESGKQPESKPTQETTQPSIDNLEQLISGIGSELKTKQETSGFTSDIFSIQDNSTPDLPHINILDRLKSGGLGVDAQFTRMISSYGLTQNVVRLIFQNYSDQPIKSIHIGKIDNEGGRSMTKFDTIDELQPGEFIKVDVSIEFNQKRSPFQFEICTETKTYPVSITPPTGELVTPSHMTYNEFKQHQDKLQGLNRADTNVKALIDPKTVADTIVRVANVAVIHDEPKSGEFAFAGKVKASSGPLVLISVQQKDSGAVVTVNCDDSILASVFSSEIANVLEKTN